MIHWRRFAENVPLFNTTTTTTTKLTCCLWGGCTGATIFTQLPHDGTVTAEEHQHGHDKSKNNVCHHENPLLEITNADVVDAFVVGNVGKIKGFGC